MRITLQWIPQLWMLMVLAQMQQMGNKNDYKLVQNQKKWHNGIRLLVSSMASCAKRCVMAFAVPIRTVRKDTDGSEE